MGYQNGSILTQKVNTILGTLLLSSVALLSSLTIIRVAHEPPFGIQARDYETRIANELE